MTNFNSTSWAKAAILGALFSAACSSDKSSGSNGKTDDAGDVTGTGGASSAGGTGSASGGGTGTGGTEKTDAAAGGSTGSDGGASGTGGTGGTAAVGRGHIGIVESTKPDSYDISAGFTSFAGLTAGQTGPNPCTTTPGSACNVCVIPNASDDAGLPTAASGLDAGALTITGVGASKGTLTYGPIAHTTISGYTGVRDSIRFFKGGDSVSASGAGGADLAAFAAETVIAPSDIVLTAPACTAGGCPDVDRTKDLSVTWTGGGAGKVTATLETIGPDNLTIITCDFDATAGKGTIPHAMLAELAKADGTNVTGIESFAARNSKDFTVGDIPTTFELYLGVVQTLITVSK